MRLKVLALVVFAAVLCWAARADIHLTSYYVRGLIAGIQSTGDGTPSLTVAQVIEDRQDLIQALIPIVERGPDVAQLTPQLDPKYQAMTLLGALRAEEAVHSLFGQLGYKAKTVATDYHEMFAYGPAHPAAQALAEIGKPASKKALYELAETEDPERTRDLVWIIVEVEGKDLAKYLIAGQKRPGEAKSGLDNLDRALAAVDEMAGK